MLRMSILDQKTEIGKKLLKEEGWTPFFRLYKSGELGDASLTLGVVIHFSEMPDGKCWASQKAIAETLGISVSAVKGHLLKLLAKKLITDCGEYKGMPAYRAKECFLEQGSEERWLALPHSVAKAQTISPIAKRTFAALMFRAEPEGSASRGVNDLAEQAGLPVRSVHRGLLALEEARLIRRYVTSRASGTLLFPPANVIPLPIEGDKSEVCQGDNIATCQGDKSEVCQSDKSEFRPCQESLLTLSEKATTKNRMENQKENQPEAEPDAAGWFPSVAGEEETIGKDAETSKQPTHPATKETSHPATKEQFCAAIQLLEKESSASELLHFNDDALATAVATAFAKTQNHPASKECSAVQILNLIRQLQEYGKTSEIRDWMAMMHNKLKSQVKLPEISKYLFVPKSGGWALLFRSENCITQIRNILYEVINQEHSCMECMKKEGIFPNALNELVCYNYAENAAPCNEQAYSDNRRKAIDLARESLRLGEPLSISPKLAEKVEQEAREYVSRNVWREWNSQDHRDREIPITSVFASPEEIAELCQRLGIAITVPEAAGSNELPASAAASEEASRHALVVHVDNPEDPDPPAGSPNEDELDFARFCHLLALAIGDLTNDNCIDADSSKLAEAVM